MASQLLKRFTSTVLPTLNKESVRFSSTANVFVDKNTKIVCQGLTGKQATIHMSEAMQHGTNVVAGVSPGKGGSFWKGSDGKFNVPVFNSVQEARDATGCDASICFVPPQAATKAILESLDVGMELIVSITEGIPLLDMVKVKHAFINQSQSRLLGPNCPGVTKSGECKLGIMPIFNHTYGKIGIVSRSGTLTYEATRQTTKAGLGQSTCVGIGGDPFNGTNFIDVLDKFMKDPQTEGIFMIGEIGGDAEEDAAEWLKYNNPQNKPICSFIAGGSSPPGRRMGHAGAIVSGGRGSAAGKKAALEAAGVTLVESPGRMGQVMLEVMKARGLA